MGLENLQLGLLKELAKEILELLTLQLVMETGTFQKIVKKTDPP